MILDTLKTLALPSEMQKDYLVSLGTYPLTDELALEFDDAFVPFIAKVDNNADEVLKVEILPGLKTIDSIFNNMDEKSMPGIWHVDSLNSEPWNEVRTIAQKLIATFERLRWA